VTSTASPGSTAYADVRLLVDRRTQSNTACPARPRVLCVRPRGQRRLASPGGLRGPLPRGRVTVRTTSATARCAARVGLGAARAGAERESLGSENAVGDSSDLLDDATNDGDSVARITWSRGDRGRRPPRRRSV